MPHGGCCNCFICKIGQSLGLMEPCVETKVKAPIKKSSKKLSVAKSRNGGTAKKTVTKKSKAKSKSKKK